MELIDSHCHLDLPVFDHDRAAVIDRCHERGVTGFVVPGVQAAGWQPLWRLSTQVPGLYPAFGLHPVFLETHDTGDVAALETLLGRHRPVAIGEIGLDYHVAGLDRERQQSLFESQLEIARTAGLPVILHVLKAHDRVLSTLKRIPVSGGIVHAFNGSLQQAQQYAALGFGFGFGGMLTFPRSNRLRALARDLPLESIVLETDAPDMTVMQHRGERNSPEYLPYCLAALAEVRAAAPDEVARITTQNVRELLGLSDWQQDSTPPAGNAGSSEG